MIRRQYVGLRVVLKRWSTNHGKNSVAQLVAMRQMSTAEKVRKIVATGETVPKASCMYCKPSFEMYGSCGL